MPKTADVMKELVAEVAALREEVRQLRLAQSFAPRVVYVPQPYPVYQPAPQWQPYSPWYVPNYQGPIITYGSLGNQQMRLTAGS